MPSATSNGRTISALTPRVQVTSSAAHSRAQLTISSDGTVMRFQLDAGSGRLLVGLLLGQRDRPVDVSLRPSVLTSALAQSAPPAAEDVAALRGWLAEFCARHGLWSSAEGEVARGLTGASFPLLAHVYALGAHTLCEVPRWAAPALAEPKARSGAVAVLGSAASRTVVAAFAASLLPAHRPPAPPPLYPLALALMGRAVLAADALARVMRAATEAQPREALMLPTVDDIARFRTMATWMGARRVERVLTDAGSIADGPRLLARTALLLDGLPAGAWVRLPEGLVALHERCRELTPIDPRPRACAREVTPDVRRADAPQRPRRATRVPRQAIAAPRATGIAPRAHDPLTYSAAVGRLHGRAVSPQLRIVLPRSVEELRTWSRLLHNCLDSFGAAVASGRSLLVGVLRNDVLTYCLELTPGSRTIRQFHGPYNRAVPAAAAAAVCSLLVAEGLVDAHHRVNLPWMDLCRTAVAGE